MSPRHVTSIGDSLLTASPSRNGGPLLLFVPLQPAMTTTSNHNAASFVLCPSSPNNYWIDTRMVKPLYLSLTIARPRAITLVILSRRSRRSHTCRHDATVLVWTQALSLRSQARGDVAGVVGRCGVDGHVPRYISVVAEG